MMPLTWSRGMFAVPLKFMCSHPVRHAGQARALVLRPDLVPAPHRGQRRGVIFLNEDLQPIVEGHRAQRPHDPGLLSAEVAITFIIKSSDTHA